MPVISGYRSIAMILALNSKKGTQSQKKKNVERPKRVRYERGQFWSVI